MGRKAHRIPDKLLIDLWHSDRSVASILTQLAVSEDWLRRRWHRLIHLQKLPSGWRTRHHLVREDDACESIITPILLAEDAMPEHLDGRPHVHSDRLLQRLFKVHGAPRADLVEIQNAR